MTYLKPLVQALESQVLSASCCSPCALPTTPPGEGGTGGGQAPPAPCYVSIAGTCLF